MKTLDRWRQGGDEHSLEELVVAANELLPQYLPEERGDARLRAEVNARLVRHLQTIALMGEAGRAGREARYGFRHLLQLLAARRLMAEGYGTGAIRKLLSDASLERLEALLHGGAQVAVHSVTEASQTEVPQAEASSSNPALEFLRGVKSRGKSSGPLDAPAAPHVRQSPAPHAPMAPAGLRWARHEVRPGLEVHVREDFRAPATPHERKVLLQEIEMVLRTLPASAGAHRRKRSSS